jgi:hypothetical protein
MNDLSLVSFAVEYEYPKVRSWLLNVAFDALLVGEAEDILTAEVHHSLISRVEASAHAQRDFSTIDENEIVTAEVGKISVVFTMATLVLKEEVTLVAELAIAPPLIDGDTDSLDSRALTVVSLLRADGQADRVMNTPEQLQEMVRTVLSLV